eukprot:scaffold92862_cov61-Cyclotella_meneghiniana.AAC.5
MGDAVSMTTTRRTCCGRNNEMRGDDGDDGVYCRSSLLYLSHDIYYNIFVYTQGLKHSEPRSLQTTCYPTASKIRLIANPGEYLHIFGFVATDPSNADLTRGKPATQTSTLNNNDVKYGPANAVDGDSATFIHTKKGNADPNPVWTVDLEAAHEVALIEIQNRYCEDTNDLDNCLGRLSYATVELLDNLDNVVDSKSFGDTTGELLLSLDFNNCLPTSSPTASPTKSPSLSPSSSPSVSPSASPTLNCYPTASKIRLIANPGEYLHIFGFVATDPSNADLTRGKPATQTSTLSDNTVKYGPANAVDGNSATLIHTKKGNADPNPVWTVDLETPSEVALIEIQNRYCGDESDADNCLGRLSYATVELLDNQDNVVDSKSFGNTTGELLPLLNFDNCLPTSSPTASPTKSPSLSPSSSPSVSPSASPTLNCYPTASKIRLIANPGEYLHIFGFVATDPSNADLTRGKPATQTSTLNNNDVKYGPANAVDGKSDTLIHTKKGNADPNPVWTVNLETPSEVALIEIQNRDCEDSSGAEICLG